MPIHMNNGADQFWVVLWRRRVSFIATLLAVMAGVMAVTFSLPKVYSTSSYLLVSTLKPTGGAFEAQQVSQVDTQTVSELLQTRNAANVVASTMPYRISATELQGKVSITPVAQTDLVLITAHESTPARAQQLANTYATVFSQQSASTITSAKVSVAAPAALITSPSSPRPKLYLLIGAILALLAATGMALLRQRLDQRLTIEDFATQLFDLPILARVPSRRGSQRTFLPDMNPQAAPVEAGYIEGFRLLFANLTFVRLGDRPSTIALVSARPQEGKSTISAAMAQTAVEMTDSVMLVDGDMRRPILSERLGVDPQSDGLSNFLAHGVEPIEVSSLVHDVHGTNLHLISSGSPPPNPSSLLGLSSLEDFVQSLKDSYDFVIFDTPPISVGADASLIAARTDGAVLVVDARTSRRASVEWALQQLRRAHVNVLGVIVNRVSDSNVAPSYYYHDGSTQSQAPRPSTTDLGRATPAARE
jgi:capsular exopolysaccharide synthesis family protein